MRMTMQVNENSQFKYGTCNTGVTCNTGDTCNTRDTCNTGELAILQIQTQIAKSGDIYT